MSSEEKQGRRLDTLQVQRKQIWFRGLIKTLQLDFGPTVGVTRCFTSCSASETMNGDATGLDFKPADVTEERLVPSVRMKIENYKLMMSL